MEPLSLALISFSYIVKGLSYLLPGAKETQESQIKLGQYYLHCAIVTPAISALEELHGQR